MVRRRRKTYLLRPGGINTLAPQMHRHGVSAMTKNSYNSNGY
jgi:hypothetical protein